MKPNTTIKITPAPLNGSVRAIPSKSHQHRLMIASALASFQSGDGICGIRDLLCWSDLETASEDIRATAACLRALLDLPAPCLFCGESGSTLRFLLPVAAAISDRTDFYGGGRLPERPLSPLREEMERKGAVFLPLVGGTEQPENQRPICRVSGRLRSGVFNLPGNISSQFITGLLLALPLLSGDSRICLTSPLESAGYVDMTMDVLDQFGIEIQVQQGTEGLPESFSVPGGQVYRFPPPPESLAPEGDWSNGAFWLAADYLSRRKGGCSVEVSGLDPHSAQGDREIVPLLRHLSNRTATLLEVDMAQIPDLAPIFAVAAALTPGITVLKNAGRLRIKESDRLRTVREMLEALGADVTEGADCLRVCGRKHLSGGTVDSAGDHRIAMAAAIASIGCGAPVIIARAEAVDKSYPVFFQEFNRLGGQIHVIEP